MAENYAPDGSLTINDGPPSVGRVAITEAARSFMVAFPDMQVLMDDLVVEDEYIEYRWTLVEERTPARVGPAAGSASAESEEWTLEDDGLNRCVARPLRPS